MNCFYCCRHSHLRWTFLFTVCSSDFRHFLRTFSALCFTRIENSIEMARNKSLFSSFNWRCAHQRCTIPYNDMSFTQVYAITTRNVPVETGQLVRNVWPQLGGAAVFKRFLFTVHHIADYKHNIKPSLAWLRTREKRLASSIGHYPVLCSSRCRKSCINSILWDVYGISSGAQGCD